MGKFVDNKTSVSNKKKAAAAYRKKKAFAPVKGSVGLKPSWAYTDEEKRKSQAQARTDAAFQKRMLAQRNLG